MKKILFTTVSLFVCSAFFGFKASAQDKANSQPEKTVPSRDDSWKLVWHDEFNEGDQPDWTVWNAENGFVRNEEYQWYQKENAYILNGVLILEARLDSIPNPRYREGSRDWRRNRPYARYSSASINTRNSYAFQYGQLEVRARIPAVIGSWPAIWTLGKNMEWPSNGECDVMEYYHVDGKPTILANAAWGDDAQYHPIWNSTRTPYSHFLKKDPYWGENFHTWLMDWDEKHITIYLDGELLNDIDLETTYNGSIGNYSNAFRHPHYILLDLAVGGINGGEPVDNAFPMRYEIDYVRVYQKQK